MPNLDFSDILVDPDLCDTFAVKRRTDVIGANGRNSQTVTNFTNLVGSVTPEEGAMTRADDSEMTARVINVICMFRLRASSDGVQPDIVVWDGVDFTVKDVKGYHRFGAGFVVAKAESMNASDPPLV